MRSASIILTALLALSPIAASSAPSSDAEILSTTPKPEQTRKPRCFQVTQVRRFEIDEHGVMRDAGGFKLIEACGTSK